MNSTLILRSLNPEENIICDIINQTYTLSPQMPRKNIKFPSVVNDGEENRDNSSDAGSDYSDDFDSGRDSGQNSRQNSRSFAAKPKKQTGNVKHLPYGTSQRPKKLAKLNGVIKQGGKEVESVAEKAKSQRRLKLHELQNEIQLLLTKQKDLESENKLLKRTQRRQAIALKRYEGHEGELPSLIRSHEEEVRALRELLRKTTEKQKMSERRETEKTNELEKMRSQLQRLQGIVKEQHLDERTTLNKKVEALQSEIESKDKNIRDLKHRLELTEKNYKHQLSIEFARHKGTKKKLHELQIRVDKISVSLKEKERELEIRNIYTGHINSNKSPKYISPKKKFVNKLTELKENNKLTESFREKSEIDEVTISHFEPEKTSPRIFDDLKESVTEDKLVENIEDISFLTNNLETVQIRQRSVLPSIDAHVHISPKPFNNLPNLKPVSGLSENNLNESDIQASHPKFVDDSKVNEDLEERPQSQIRLAKSRKTNLMHQLFGDVSSLNEGFSISLSSEFDGGKSGVFTDENFTHRNTGNLLPLRRRERSNMISNQLRSPVEDDTSPILL